MAERPAKLSIYEENLKVYEKALRGTDDNRTCRIQSKISDPKTLILLAGLIELQPIPSVKEKPKKIQLIANEIGCSLKDLQTTWYNVLESTLIQGYDYVIIENCNGSFIYAIDVRAIVNRFELNAMQLLKCAHKFFGKKKIK